MNRLTKLAAMMTVCALFATTALSANDKAETAFAGVPWGSTAATVKQRMSAHGFTFVKADRDGDLGFAGSLNGEPARMHALLTKDDKLVKWMVLVGPPDHRTLNYYRDLKHELTARYGEAHVDHEERRFPYARGEHVGHEETAIRVGKGVLRAAWTTGGELPGVIIEITDRLAVTASYEGPSWNEEANRRKTQIW